MSIARFLISALVASILALLYLILVPIADPYIGQFMPSPPLDKLAAFAEYLLIPAFIVVLVAGWFGVWKAQTNYAYKLWTAALAFLLPPVMAGNMVIVSCYVFAQCI